MTEAPRRRSGFFPVWVSLGVRAFRRSFWCRCFGCEAGGRDFVWLTLLLTLVITMTLVFVGTRAGFLDRLADTLIGHIEPNGVPIWVTSHWENQQGIDSDLLRKLTEVKLPLAPHDSPPGEAASGGKVPMTVFPYRRLGDTQPGVHLPVQQAWKGSSPFSGWAVNPDDPLWKLSRGGSARLGMTYEDERSPWLGLPLEVVLNAAQFRRHFDYVTYREAVAPRLAELKRPSLPPTLDWDNPERALDFLWMRVTVSQEERLVPFKVHWVSHIPSMEPIAFLFPLTTYHALLAAHHLPDLRYQPENEGRGDSLQDHLFLTRPDYPREAMTRYAACIQKEIGSTGIGDLPDVSQKKCPLPPDLVKQIGSDAKAGEASSWKGAQWDTLNHDRNHQVWVPCRRLSQGDALRHALCRGSGVESAGHVFVPWDLTHAGLAFSTVHLFIPNASHLARVIEQIQEMRTQDGRRAFNIHPTYLDAMSRFNLLSDMLGSLIPAFAGSFLLLLTALLFAQIGGVMDRRRNHFGILMSRGFSWLTIYAKVILQMILATLLGSLVAVFGLVPTLRWFMMRDFNLVLSRYSELLPPNHGLEIMPLSWQPIFLTVAGVAAAVILVVVILLLRIPLWWKTTPSDLLHGSYANSERHVA
ncbi:MAG: hypothetical protein HQL63_02445 [Magnetococcales bacterium]|nr:hypothetical protein [Magnetococcales bacterium]MBF0321394.1 hypothetical protein [Magnetococcales bacterium]